MNDRSLNPGHRLMLVLLYCAFFFVHVFSQAGNIRLTDSGGYQQFHQSGAASLSSGGRPSDALKPGIRLSKRFHPESLCAVCFYWRPPPVFVLTPAPAARAVTYLPVAPSLLRPLRGPPQA